MNINLWCLVGVLLIYRLQEAENTRSLVGMVVDNVCVHICCLLDYTTLSVEGVSALSNDAIMMVTKYGGMCNIFNIYGSILTICNLGTNLKEFISNCDTINENVLRSISFQVCIDMLACAY